MAPDVERAFVELFRNRSGVNEQEAEEWMVELEESKRYLLDGWPRN